MDVKKGLDGQVEKVIDQAADIAKRQVNTWTGKGEKKEKNQGEGVGDMVSGAINKVASEAAANKAAEQVKSFGKSFLG